MKKETVLITGASSGIGLELAREFARRGHALVITAPQEAELAAVAAELTRDHAVAVTPIARDLTRESAPQEIFDELERAGIAVDVLVNNAGVGQRGEFWAVPLEKDLQIIRLNVEAVVRLTKLFLAPMVKRRRGKILNTASIAGFEPGPRMAIYHASKAFVLSFSESLATELEDDDVSVTALCPGPVDTDFFSKADLVDAKIFQEGNVMAPQEVATAAYEALFAGDRVLVPGGMNKALVFSRRLMSESTQARLNEKTYEDADLERRKREPGEVAAKARRPV